MAICFEIGVEYRGEIEPLVEGAGAGGAVANPGHRDEIAPAHPGTHGDAGRHGNRIPEHADGADDDRLLNAFRREVHDMNVQIAAARVRFRLGHVLKEDLLRTHTHGRQRAHVADERQHRIRPPQCVRRAHGLPFLPETAIEAAYHLALAEEDDEPLFDIPRQAREVIHLEPLILRQGVGRTGGSS
jgi:hypothetical protein